MTNLAKRSLALILALVLCLSLLPVTAVPVSAASYIYNWGTRGVVATSLSENAQAFYTGNNTYDALASLAGGTSKETAPNSNLYKALQNLMVGAQNSQTSYDDTRDLFKYTDCQNGGGKISSFYSGTEIGPDWDSGSTWNREHTWPNSKGDASGNGENDIMMLRPTAKSENGSRGNKAYGESSSYYFPNRESNGTHDVRGDVARIMLFVYCRWGNIGSMWGYSGVMESKEILLKWVEEDPVDTWELGRNDATEAITGTRNVFVDYPELIFVMFGTEIPEDMATPSGNAMNQDCAHEDSFAIAAKAPTCVLTGNTAGRYCNDCDTYYDGYTVLKVTDHRWKVATCTAPKTCVICGTTTGSANGHSWQAATCTDPKTCGNCGATEGKTAGHRYDNNVDGTCNGCGADRAELDASMRQVVHMFRMYNPNTGEHFYTGSEVEKNNLVVAGWHYEGIGFTYPANTGDPVYRLFQPSTGEHLYTMDVAEKDRLMAAGWNYEGIAFNSAYNTEAVQHRLHNPNAQVGAYHFTFSEEEKQVLIDAGWEYQGIGWYSCWK